jgi:16S rRNA (guanine1207-N2)-methyltransferase
VPQYFDESPDVGSDVRNVDVSLAGLAFTMQTDRGVFSHGHLDTGTALLLHEAPPPSSTGNLLDLGCGSGPIALTLALRSPGATVWAIDTNERARRLTEHNAEHNGVTNIRVCAPSAVPPDIEFDTMWSNPPIRIGKAALHELLAGWLARLTADGTAIMVVQKHLGADSLQRWLIDQGYPTERISSRAGFRLLTTTTDHRATSGAGTVEAD